MKEGVAQAAPFFFARSTGKMRPSGDLTRIQIAEGKRNKSNRCLSLRILFDHTTSNRHTAAMSQACNGPVGDQRVITCAACWHSL